MSRFAKLVRSRLSSELHELPADGSASEIELERAWGDALATARAAWPGVDADEDAVASLVAEHLARGDVETSVGERLAHVAVADLYIACACAAGSAAGLAAFEARYFSQLGSVLARTGADRAVVDEVRQILREKLFVARPELRARVLDLAGHGDLASLVRIAAVRTALNLRRSTHRLDLVEHPSMVSGVVFGTPERDDVLKQLQRDQVERAFEEALAELEVRDRTVLRMHLLHGASIDEIGRVHGVHRATAARWLDRIREQLRDATVRKLRDQLALPTAEAESLIRFVQSRIEVSFSRLLGA